MCNCLCKSLSSWSVWSFLEWRTLSDLTPPSKVQTKSHVAQFTDGPVNVLSSRFESHHPHFSPLISRLHCLNSLFQAAELTAPVWKTTSHIYCKYNYWLKGGLFDIAVKLSKRTNHDLLIQDIALQNYFFLTRQNFSSKGGHRTVACIRDILLLLQHFKVPTF